VVRIASAIAPTEVLINGKPLDASQSDYREGLLRIRFANSTEALSVTVRYKR
jgi:hypothetical protein